MQNESSDLDSCVSHLAHDPWCREAFNNMVKDLQGQRILRMAKASEGEGWLVF